MKKYKVAIIGFGSLGQRALVHLINSIVVGSVQCTSITIVDLRPDAADAALEGLLSVYGKDLDMLKADKYPSIEVTNFTPKNMDIYWITIPCKRNVHDSPVDVKPLNKLISTLQLTIHDESIIFNSTMVPIGRNLKLHKKLTMEMPSDVSWFYVPITRDLINTIGTLKQTPHVKKIIKEIGRAFDLNAYNVDEVELATLAYYTRQDLLTQHANEVSTISHARGLDAEELKRVTRALGTPPSKGYASGANVSTTGSLAAHMMVDKHDVPFSYLSDRYKLTPLLNGMLASGKYREDYVVSQIIHIAKALKPNRANEAFLFLHGASEQANAIAYRLQKSVELPDYICLYQVAYDGVATPEIMTMSPHDARQIKGVTHIRICQSANCKSIDYTQEFI